MRFALPTRSPSTPRPRQPEIRPGLPETPPASPQPSWRSRFRRPRRPGRRQVLAVLAAAGVAVLLVFFFIGWHTDAEVSVVAPTPISSPAAPKATGGEPPAGPPVAAERVNGDLAIAQRLAAAKAADERAAEQRAAEAEAARAEAARKQVVAMPALVGLKLDNGMDLAADAGLTAVEVCHTPDGDTPLWWSNWRITGQDVPPGTRVSAGRTICVSAAK